MKLWTPTSGFPAAYLTKRLRIPRESDLKGHGILLQDFHRTGGKETSVLEDTNKTWHAPRLRGKEQ